MRGRFAGEALVVASVLQRRFRASGTLVFDSSVAWELVILFLGKDV
jgi:hypothetical protein